MTELAPSASSSATSPTANEILGAQASTAALPQWVVRWVPLVTAAAVAGLFYAFQVFFAGEGLDISKLAQKSLHRNLAWNAHITAARTSWAAATFVATAITVALAAFAIIVMKNARLPRIVVWFAGFSVVAIWWVLHHVPELAAPRFIMQETDLIKEVSGFDPTGPLLAFLSALFSTATLVALALGTLMDRVSGTPSLAELLSVKRSLRGMLAGGTAWLVVGVIGIGLFHRMASAGAFAKAAPAMDAVGAASTVFAGAFYSALLAAAFGPAELFLRHAARRLAPAATRESEKSADQWLTDEGFDLTIFQELKGVIAVLGPLLAGIIQGIAQLK